MRLSSWIPILLLAAFAGVIVFVLVLVSSALETGPAKQEKTVVISRGNGVVAIADQLKDAEVVHDSLAFIIGVKLIGASRIKSGEYSFPRAATLVDVIDILRRGQTVTRRFTAPEGLTSAQIVALLRAEPALTGEIGEIPKEGALLPETYHYSYGDARGALLDRMRAAMTATLAELWAKRAASLPWTTPEQATTIASVIEKETGVAAERPRIAGVFVNRLATGMKLQSDPTVIYALTNGEGALGRPLTRADWRFASPYNTYHVEGLPPGPIANPGRAALTAALHPERHEFLYFVADGGGGHVFARTLADHNKNVAKHHQDK